MLVSVWTRDLISFLLKEPRNDIPLSVWKNRGQILVSKDCSPLKRKTKQQTEVNKELTTCKTGIDKIEGTRERCSKIIES